MSSHRRSGGGFNAKGFGGLDGASMPDVPAHRKPEKSQPAATTVVSGAHFGNSRTFVAESKSEKDLFASIVNNTFREKMGGISLKTDSLHYSGDSGMHRSPSLSSVSSTSSTPSIASFSRHPLARTLSKNPSIEVASEEGPMHQSPASLETFHSPQAKALSRPQLEVNAPGKQLLFSPLTPETTGPVAAVSTPTYSEHDADEICEDEEEDMPSRPSIAMSESAKRRAFAAVEEPKFCLGIKWFIRQNKLVVGSFSSWSVADKLGVKHGDILRAVDGQDILRLAAPAEGEKHPAEDLLNGEYGTMCELKLMRVDAEQVKQMVERANSGESTGASSERLILTEVSVSIPRLIMCKPGENMT